MQVLLGQYLPPGSTNQRLALLVYAKTAVKEMNTKTHHTFETPEQLQAWLQVNHASETELWVHIYKKTTGQPSVTWDDCVVTAIAWGWIDGLRKSLDDTSFLQRLTPRRARSNWSQKNVQHAERLIAQGHMQAAGHDFILYLIRICPGYSTS